MSSNWPAALLSVVLTATAGPAFAAEDPLARNKAAARVIFDQILGGGWHVDLIDAVHTPDFVAHGATRDAGLEQDRQAVLGWRKAAPDLAMTVDAILAEGNLVAVRWTGRGTNTGEGNGLPATGRRFSLRGATFFRMRDGRIAEEWNVIDQLEGLRQLGLLPEAGAPGSPAPAATSGEAERNRALARRVFDEILNHGRYELFQELYAPDFVKHVDRQDATLADEIRDARAMRAASSDLVLTADRMIAEGDRVAILYTGRGTSTGPFAGLPPTGRSYVVSGMTVYRFANGRIAEEWTTYNMLDILRQLGYSAGASKP
jgi:steroid delta-isomerase-like uncharacterized protein